MTLKPGKILRFKGPTAEADIAQAAAELRGKCRRNGMELHVTAMANLPMSFLNAVEAKHQPNGATQS